MKSPWERLEQAATAGRPGLAAPAIAAAAVAIADADGLDAISMRRIADELGVAWPLLLIAVFFPLSLHRYRRLSR